MAKDTIGTDVSKAGLDAFWYSRDEARSLPNSPEGFAQLCDWVGRTALIARRRMRPSSRSMASGVRFHHRKPKGRRMAPHIRRGNAGRSRVRAAIEHVFARQMRGMGLFVRTIGIARAKMKIGMANLVYNIGRLAWQERQRGFA